MADEMTAQREVWNGKWKGKERLPPNAFAKRALAIIQEHGVSHVLDLGCGNGCDTAYFARNGLQVTAVDFSDTALEAMRGTPNVTTRRADIRSFRPDETFDAIYAHLSLHYFTDEETRQVFKNLHDMLRAGGILFVKCKSTDDLLYWKGEEVGPDMFLHNSHVRHFFSKDYLRELLAGFSSVKVRKTSSVYHSYKCSFVEAVAIK